MSPSIFKITFLAPLVYNSYKTLTVRLIELSKVDLDENKYHKSSVVL